MTTPDREAIGELPNPLGLAGIEFIEFSTSKPQALGQVLETIGFKPVARHRSREVLLYRQGPMNIIVNAHASELPRAEVRIYRLRTKSRHIWRMCSKRGETLARIDHSIPAETPRRHRTNRERRKNGRAARAISRKLQRHPGFARLSGRSPPVVLGVPRRSRTAAQKLERLDR